jgi:hypothetical protein
MIEQQQMFTLADMDAAERRGYLRGIEDAARGCNDETECGNHYADAILALKDKP